ncbi:hypothetical protein FOXB_10731 [Fusarium oxysporum f. sp. conglutinans Fo5176]|uniref:BTB domain-containing protein n=1 Tax=Fusarium oxysporum (strain Fo5176) TaxID=660025 RepID=F9FWE9_FUSOF|nr:hypothetical protein FOXB_10731 [Fusarium oxysporum f. sp. conglutinans Fo5176]
MKKSLLELDPDADALLILQSPNLQQVHAAKEVDLRDTKDKAEPKTTASTPAKGKKKSKTLTDLKKIKSLQPYREDGSPNELEFRVSTKHLCIASPVFRKMIQGNFQESQPKDKGLFEIRTSSWNTQALLVLLDIIHGHHRQVPRDLDLDTIAQIGFLVDYYDCLEIVEVFFDLWQAHLSDWWKYGRIYFDISSIHPFGESQLLMLFIDLTFRNQVVFKNLTISAILTTSGHIKTHLPIPSQILDKVANPE